MRGSGLTEEGVISGKDRELGRWDEEAQVGGKNKTSLRYESATFPASLYVSSLSPRATVPPAVKTVPL